MGDSGERNLRWYQGLTKYHWWVLVIGVMSWMFDCMDQRLFVLSRAPAVKELLDWDERVDQLTPDIQRAMTAEVKVDITAGLFPPDQQEEQVQTRVEAALKAEFAKQADSFGNIVTALMIVGWSVGGIAFGVYGDRLGRVKTLAIAIGVYSIFTGLSGLSVGLWDFCIYRFLMGCGIGGAFATAATLIAETMPSHARATALGLFQALSALGNITGSFIARFIVSPDMPTNLFGLLGDSEVSGWRVLFMIGVIPAVLVVIIMRSVREPEAWTRARQNATDRLGRELGDVRSLFGTPRWRRNTIVGISLAVIGVIGLWGVGFYSPELVDTALKDIREQFPDDVATQKISNVKAMGTLLQDVGALLGMLAFTYIATRMGRKVAFGGAFVFCWIVVCGVFMFLTESWHAYVMLPLLGFATLSLFGGYSIYFPELFPTRLRATGTGFCYNVGRVLAAAVILFKIPIREGFTNAGFDNVFRVVSVALASVYLLGLVVLIWAPETRNQPLPTEEDE
jgi:MFS family permease